MKNGVPFDVAFSLSDVDRAAYCLIFGTFEGNTWDWDRMAWKER